MDCTFKTEEGKFNYRVGAIIRNGNRILMARNPGETRGDMWYSVGGRVRFGETAEEACLRELKEETGLELDLSDCADKQIFPDFFKTVDFSREKGVKHFVTESSVPEFELLFHMKEQTQLD